MRWPIRNQILLPFVTVQVLTVCLIAVVASRVAVRTVERQIQARLTNVMTTLRETSFPLTSGILDQMRLLSDAHFIVFDNEFQVVGSTLNVDSDWKQWNATERGQSAEAWTRSGSPVLDRQETVDVAGELYFAGRIQRPGVTRNGFVLVLYRQADWRTARQQAMYPPLLIGGTLLLITVTASMFLAGRLGRRIHRLQRQVARIADGDFAPVPLSRVDDELRDLSSAVNRTAVLLEDAMERVRETERSRLSTQLVGGVAHQLRNAITGARISVQLHQRRCPAEPDEAISIALQQLGLVEEQIRALLRATRGESREVVNSDIGLVLAGTVALVNPICAHQHIELKCQPPNAQWTLQDADGMRAGLLNVIMNAIEACGPGGKINVLADVTTDRLRIEIADDGPGIADPSQIFRPFFSTKPEGAGLGLALARKEVEDCGGTLTVRRENQQTIFQIQLPRPNTVVAEAPLPNGNEV